MTWNYRIVKDGSHYSIRSVYYSNEYYSNDKPHSWSEEPEAIVAESVEELKVYLDLYNQALERPVLEVEPREDCLKEALQDNK